MSDQNNKTDNKIDYEKKLKRLKIISAILMTITVVIVVILLLKNCVDCGDKQERVSLNYDTNSEIGQLDSKTDEEIQAELDRVVAENMFNVSINVTPEFIDGSSEGELCIENVPGNHFLMSVKITLDDTGEVIYQSGLIKPNYHIQRAKLDKNLPAGTYDATAEFTAHDMDTGEVEGHVNMKMTIYVDN